MEISRRFNVGDRIEFVLPQKNGDLKTVDIPVYPNEVYNVQFNDDSVMFTVERSFAKQSTDFLNQPNRNPIIIPNWADNLSFSLKNEPDKLVKLVVERTK